MFKSITLTAVNVNYNYTDIFHAINVDYSYTDRLDCKCWLNITHISYAVEIYYNQYITDLKLQLFD